MAKASSRNKKNSLEDKQGILLIGDWLLDEHWVTGTQSISTSTHTGDIHRFIDNDINQEIIYLSGAGRVTSILLREESFKLYSIGVWEKDGDRSLKSFFTEYLKTPDRFRRNEFRIKWEVPERIHNDEFPGEVNLYNLHKPSTADKKDEIGTKRAFRIYEKIGQDIKLSERIDFMKSKDDMDISKTCNENISRVLKELKDKKINAIVIKDMDHGTVTDVVIKKIIEAYGKNRSIKWFISSKRWKPAWLKEFRKKNIPIELYMIPQAAAKQAIKEETKTLNTWITPMGWVTLEALEFIREPGKLLVNELPGSKIKLNIQHLVILPEQDRVVAYKKENPDHDLFIQPEAKDSYSEIDLPMASVYFPEIIKRMLLPPTTTIVKTTTSRTTTATKAPVSKTTISKTITTFEEILKEALDATILWRKKRFYTIKKIEPPEKINLLDIEPSDRKPGWEKAHLEKSKGRWEQAFKGVGIVNVSPRRNKDNPKRFELWRGMTTLDDYICLSKRRRSEIRKLLLNLKREKESQLKRAEVCFIKAHPGSGKSFLVECLARVLGLELVSFNLSQIYTKSQIISCFDQISTAQAENKYKPLVIFFDEMNTPIEGTYPYSLFLAPLEDGYYLRDTHKFRLSPSIWIFVGTEFEKGKKDKASDFQSRLTLPIVDLKAKDRKQDLGLERLEKIYYCVSFIRRTFKEVTDISDGALKILAEINAEASPRNIRKFVESIEYIPFEKVDAECIKKTINRHKGDERVTNLFQPNKFKKIFSINDSQSDQYVSIFDKPG